MNILVATNHLEKIGGTESYTYALVQELVKRGHNVEYFTFCKGEISKRIEALGVKFRSRFFYDLILANHYTTVDNLYSRGYIIQTCHGITIGVESPSSKANHYVAITPEVQEYLSKKGFQSSIIYNGIDCNRFYPQKPVSKKLKNILSLCQSEEANILIKGACQQLGIAFQKFDKYLDNVWDIEKEINKADLVIGIGRSLFDAMACGRPVISFDCRSYSGNLGDGYLTPNILSQSLNYNCSGRYSKKQLNQATLIEEIKKYNAVDGLFFRNFALSHLNIEHAVNQYLNLTPKHLILWRIKKTFVHIGRYFYWGIKVLFNTSSHFFKK